MLCRVIWVFNCACACVVVVFFKCMEWEVQIELCNTCMLGLLLGISRGTNYLCHAEVN